MKIHNYGSDYAFQLRQKTRQEKPTISEQPTKIESTDADNQVQTGGERSVANDPQGRNIIQTPRQVQKKKKKASGKKR